MVKIKVCGITSLRDAEAAARLGADAIGFIFAPSPRRITPEAAHKIARAMGPYVTLVGVFVDETPGRMLKIAARCRLNAIQLHGDETPQVCKSLAPYKVVKTLRMSAKFSAAQANRYEADAFLLETDAAVRGGSGKTWDWKVFPAGRLKRPIIVSGGLNPQNVRQAVRILKPYAVDVSSGVERRPGVKDHTLLERFIQHAKQG